METIRKFAFTNSKGEQLMGRLDVPVDGHIQGMAIFAHCFTCSRNLHAVRQVSTGLNRQGIAVLSFDFTGIGDSDVAFEDTNFSANIQDLVDAAAYATENLRAPDLIIGHSLGGAAAILAAAKIPSVRAVATINAPADPAHVRALFSTIEEDIESTGQGNVILGGRPFTITQQFLNDLEEHDVAKTLSRLKRAYLVVHSPVDQTVSIDNATKLFVAAKHPKSFVSLDKADHLLSKSEDAIYTGEIIGQWAHKYFCSEAQEDTLSDGGAQVVTRTGRQGFHTDIKVREHGLVADEPKSYGGTNHGPTPYDLLLAGLGACTSMTLRMYADRKKWPLEAAIVRLDHAKRHVEDCDTCGAGERSPKLDHIERRVELIGDLSEEQRARLLEIADRCPVHRTLHSEVRITTVHEPAAETV